MLFKTWRQKSVIPVKHSFKRQLFLIRQTAVCFPSAFRLSVWFHRQLWQPLRTSYYPSCMQVEVDETVSNDTVIKHEGRPGGACTNSVRGMESRCGVSRFRASSSFSVCIGIFSLFRLWNYTQACRKQLCEGLLMAMTQTVFFSSRTLKIPLECFNLASAWVVCLLQAAPRFYWTLRVWLNVWLLKRKMGSDSLVWSSFFNPLQPHTPSLSCFCLSLFVFFFKQKHGILKSAVLLYPLCAAIYFNSTLPKRN